EDDLQDVIEVVGDAPGQCADGFHLLCFAQLGFEVSLRGDIAKDHDRAMEHPTAATNENPAAGNRYLATMPGEQHRLGCQFAQPALPQHRERRIFNSLAGILMHNANTSSIGRPRASSGVQPVSASAVRLRKVMACSVFVVMTASPI